jgi:hypothetical protein
VNGQKAYTYGSKQLPDLGVSAQTVRREADAVTDWLPAEIRRDPNGFVLTGQKAAKAAWPSPSSTST